jgi:hypothetical protein
MFASCGMVLTWHLVSPLRLHYDVNPFTHSLTHAIVITFLPYVILRLYGARENVPWAREWSIDILAVAAVFMFPRYISAALSFENIHDRLFQLGSRLSASRIIS